MQQRARHWPSWRGHWNCSCHSFWNPIAILSIISSSIVVSIPVISCHCSTLLLLLLFPFFMTVYIVIIVFRIILLSLYLAQFWLLCIVTVIGAVIVLTVSVLSSSSPSSPSSSSSSPSPSTSSLPAAASSSFSSSPWSYDYICNKSHWHKHKLHSYHDCDTTMSFCFCRYHFIAMIIVIILYIITITRVMKFLSSFLQVFLFLGMLFVTVISCMFVVEGLGSRIYIGFRVSRMPKVADWIEPFVGVWGMMEARCTSNCWDVYLHQAEHMLFVCLVCPSKRGVQPKPWSCFEQLFRTYMI